MRGGAKRSLKAFIEEIPDSALVRLRETPGTFYHDQNFRLDMQGVSAYHDT